MELQFHSIIPNSAVPYIIKCVDILTLNTKCRLQFFSDCIFYHINNQYAGIQF